MGHSSIAVTLDRYGYLLPSLDAGIADGFDREMQAAKANRDSKVIHANFGNDAVVGQAQRRKKLDPSTSPGVGRECSGLVQGSDSWYLSRSGSD